MKCPAKEANPYAQNFSESHHITHLTLPSFQPIHSYECSASHKFPGFLTKEPLTIKGKRRSRGGGPMSSSLPNHDAKEQKGKTEKRQKTKQEKSRADCKLTQKYRK